MNELFKLENKIYRVLKPGLKKILVVDCVKRSMPFYMDPIELNGYFMINENDLLNDLNINLKKYDDLEQKEKNDVNRKYGTISYVLNFIDEFHMLNEAIRKVAEMNNVCEATIRRRLCDYLTFQNIVVFLPNVTKKVKELNDDEKNFRW